MLIEVAVYTAMECQGNHLIMYGLYLGGAIDCKVGVSNHTDMKSRSSQVGAKITEG